jgi:hypothetical protein
VVLIMTHFGPRDSWLRRLGVRRGVAASFVTLGCIATGCIASNVVAEQDRAVLNRLDTLQWSAALATDIPGMFESVELQGVAAGSLWKVHYYFADGGGYTAAALVQGADGPRFQARHGSWRWVDGQLVLDGADPVAVSCAEDHLRIAAPTGTVVLRRRELR